MPDIDAEIIAYLRDGRSIPLPDCFYWVTKKRFSSREEAQCWVEERQSAMAQGGPLSKLAGLAVADPQDPIEKQIQDAMESTVTYVIAEEHNDTISQQAADWLRAAILGLPPSG
ncbi:hypothetical protein [Marinobacter orientalis]|nr:hypothetical protein [Marinobacter orientalis]